MARSFAYADIPTFKYQTFDYKSVQFTNIPLATRKKIEKEDGEANAEGVGDDKISEAAGEAAPEPSELINTLRSKTLLLMPVS